MLDRARPVLGVVLFLLSLCTGSAKKSKRWTYPRYNWGRPGFNLQFSSDQSCIQNLVRKEAAFCPCKEVYPVFRRHPCYPRSQSCVLVRYASRGADNSAYSRTLIVCLQIPLSVGPRPLRMHMLAVALWEESCRSDNCTLRVMMCRALVDCTGGILRMRSCKTVRFFSEGKSYNRFGFTFFRGVQALECSQNEI